MKKILFYILLTVSFVLLLPYIVSAILIEYYFRLVILLIDKPASYVRDCGKYPKWISAIFSYIDKLQEYDYED
jgi:hypothetical protein